VKTFYFLVSIDAIEARNEAEAVIIAQAKIAQGDYEIELDDVDEA